jgi:hypothetical protein
MLPAVFSEYDTWSDIAQHYRIRSVPSFLFMAEGGSVVKRLFLSDVRRLTGSTAWIQSVLQADMRRLKESINEVGQRVGCQRLYCIHDP